MNTRRAQHTRVWAPSAAALVLTGCFGNRAVPDVADVTELPEAYSSERAEEVDSVPLEQWCTDFGSPKLDGLVHRAFEDNLNLRGAWARLEQSEAVARQTNANMFPTLDANAQANQSQTSLRGSAFGELGGPGMEQPTFFTITAYNLSAAAGYEVDLWGKLAAQRQAAAFDVEASRADVETIALSLTSEIAEAWFDIVQQRQKRALVTEQLELNERYVELLKLRLENGSSTALDVNQQQQQVDQLLGQMQNIDALEQRALNRLSTLLGQVPGNDLAGAAEELPELGPMPVAGVPADLLSRRPDLRRAERQLLAANKRIAVAVRDRLPSLRLSVSWFFQAGAEISEIFEDLLYTAAAQAGAPLVDGGRRRAEVARAEAAERAAFYAYANAFVNATAEVENAMLSEYYQERFIDILQERRDKASVALELSRERYLRGGLDFLRVLTALQSLQLVEQSLVDAQRQQLSNRIQLCRALGGTWTQQLQAPPEDDSEEHTP
ncbi:MAG: efflux transporter outer membrane subunit [Myxococcota bacterium]